MKKTGKKSIQVRIIIIGIFFGLLHSVIIARAVQLHVFKGSWLSEKAENQYKRSFTATGKRGTIFDAKHREMAVSIDVMSIAGFPESIRDPDKTAKTLGSILGIKHRDLKRKLASKRSFVWVKRYATPREVELIKTANLEGISFLPEHSRVYPNRSLGSQILGFSGIDGQGLEGLEFYYNQYLKGATAIQTVIQDALGRRFLEEKKVFAEYNGNNLILTIDKAIQYITESSLDEAVQKFSGKSGIAVVMEPATGAILALAHYPRFNPNTYQDFNRSRWRNRAITDPFEPGSTMKIFLATAALESGFCTPSSIFYCEDGRYRVGRNYIHDTHRYGWLSLQQIVKVSSNIGTVKIAERIGKEHLYNTLKNFGFGERTGIDCPGETTGTLTPQSRWSKIDFGAISFGQGISVSAIQLITAVSAIANDGILMKPYIVQAITDGNGRLVENFRPQKVRSVISHETAGTMKKIMQTVTTEGGTGVAAALDGYTVCGKTGTAQKVHKNGGYAEHNYVASFIGFAPAEDPRVAVLVVIDEPQEEHYGGIVAAPPFKRITYETLSYLNVPPRRDKAIEHSEKLTVSRQKGVKG
ncbi:MAG: penicillin-binding protein 2 [Desulfobacteraceae bacterium]|nr:MAG: penicillin-binding protein 2 [Desulfobacteraceae bacterium]